MKSHYFSVDGNYGDSEDIEIINTSSWTDDDWDEINESSDIFRIYVAREIKKKYKDKE